MCTHPLHTSKKPCLCNPRCQSGHISQSASCQFGLFKCCFKRLTDLLFSSKSSCQLFPFLCHVWFWLQWPLELEAVLIIHHMYRFDIQLHPAFSQIIEKQQRKRIWSRWLLLSFLSILISCGCTGSEGNNYCDMKDFSQSKASCPKRVNSHKDISK